MNDTERIRRIVEAQNLEQKRRAEEAERRKQEDCERKEEAYRKREERRSKINTAVIVLTFLLTLFLAIMELIPRG